MCAPFPHPRTHTQPYPACVLKVDKVVVVFIREFLWIQLVSSHHVSSSKPGAGVFDRAD